MELIILQHMVPKFESHAQDQYLCVLQSHVFYSVDALVPCKCSQPRVSIFGIMKWLLFLNMIELHKIKEIYVRVMNHDGSNCQSVCASKSGLTHQQ